jgi:DNA mismatch repair protein MutL
MNKIIILDDALISKIAAGEVVERPASVIKELVENSIDAGAKNISIEVKDGGKRSIRISDDGNGMSREEAKLSLKRHSTSKLKSSDDLFNIRTLGFRGEALPSIASISRFEMITNDGENTYGSKLVIEGGKIKNDETAGAPTGTSITVEELFFNTPARLKFQKSKNTELSHITDIVSKFIFSNPNISFKLKSEKEEILSSTGNGKLIDAIASVYGADMAKVMIKIEMRDAKCEVRGYITQPVVTKSDRNGESIFVNGRYIRNMLISRALEDPYRTLIPNGKYPIAALFIDINPADVDVNVHPTKREVKFARPDEVMRAVSSAVSSALSQVGVASESKSYSGSWRVAEDNWRPEMIRIMEEPQTSNFQLQNNSQIPNPNIQTGALMQINLTYIIAGRGEELVIIDQHAAHERIMFEKIKNKVIAGTQSLLVPKSIEMEATEFSLLSSNMDEISQLGFDIEVFGKNTIMVRGLPAALSLQNINEAISEILSELSASFKIKSLDERKEAIWKMMACKAAVKAGDKLSAYEMDSLIKELYQTSNPTTCPHGRPTLVKVTRNELEKMFGR